MKHIYGKTQNNMALPGTGKCQAEKQELVEKSEAVPVLN
jgi:hypothetical protein